MREDLLATELFVSEIATLPDRQLRAVIEVLKALNSNPDQVQELSPDEPLYQLHVEGIGTLLFTRESEPDGPLLAIAFVPLAAARSAQATA